MSELERFTRFLVREAARYNAPPETPRERLWIAIDAALLAPEMGSAAASSDSEFLEASSGYNEPPVTPHDEMWRRIEPAWEMRRAAPWGAMEAGLDELPIPVMEERERSITRPGFTKWATGIGIAASLVIGIAIGRNTAEVPEAVVASSDAAATPQATIEPSPASAGDPTRWNVAVRFATAKHLGQAETLLTSFRADAAGGEEMVPTSGWARDLLGETRLLLDLPVERDPEEQALLRELELVLAQIARLGPDAPEFERDLINEGLVREGTIARLRAAAPPGSSGTIGT